MHTLISGQHNFIEQEMSVLRKGNLSVITYYNEVNRKLLLLTNKTFMACESNTEITNAINKRNQDNALRVFIAILSQPLGDILCSLNQADLPNTLATVRE